MQLIRERLLTMKISTLAAALALGMFVSGTAFAQTAAPAPTPSAAAVAKPDAATKAAKSAECSKEADAKGLHGKERKKFREECKKGK